MSLHAIDAKPGPTAMNKEEGQHKEIRRRVWWYIASSEWLLSVMGGCLDRTYAVNPHHTMVNFPANANNDDPSAAQPAGTATDMTYFILRIRLAEACRKVSDAFPFGSSCEINELPYDRIAAISRLFDEAYAWIPPCHVPSSMPLSARTERRVIHLGFHARRARIFRPFLLSSWPNQQKDARFSQFRALCLHSARVVLEIASELVREGLDAGKARTKWSGCVISHLFIACVVLATHPALTSQNSLNDQAQDPEAEDIRSELNDARRLLERAAEVSSVAGNLVRKLVGVLKRHRVLPTVAASTAAETLVGERAVNTMTPISTSLSENTTTVVDDSNDAAWLPAGQLNEGFRDGSWSLRDHNQGQPLTENLEWGDLVGSAFPDGDGWDQLFADLDATFPAPFFS
ncbi:hypothetical protein B0T14DRAFT_571248 [Immersiella caudata]|uniref:Transcription factor domain-containing protein n=1 Tax=Immersiella caudata TaxID=314043 RepID=A0AA39TXV0_9PEZI|nr:hypothetical protein B0T14DRAFT_571248 [Immersiella caudata]